MKEPTNKQIAHAVFGAILHILRNPQHHSKDAVDRARDEACSLLEELAAANRNINNSLANAEREQRIAITDKNNAEGALSYMKTLLHPYVLREAGPLPVPGERIARLVTEQMDRDHREIERLRDALALVQGSPERFVSHPAQEEIDKDKAMRGDIK